jgi:hypothetical protein
VLGVGQHHGVCLLGRPQNVVTEQLVFIGISFGAERPRCRLGGIIAAVEKALVVVRPGNAAKLDMLQHVWHGLWRATWANF